MAWSGTTEPAIHPAIPAGSVNQSSPAHKAVPKLLDVGGEVVNCPPLKRGRRGTRSFRGYRLDVIAKTAPMQAPAPARPIERGPTEVDRRLDPGLRVRLPLYRRRELCPLSSAQRRQTEAGSFNPVRCMSASFSSIRGDPSYPPTRR